MSDKPLRIATGAFGERVLAAMIESSALISAALDQGTTLEAIARGAAEVLDAEASSVLLLDAHRQQLVFKAAHGVTASELLGQAMASDLGIAGRVAQSGQSVVVPDAQTDPDHFAGFDQRTHFRTRSMLVAPMLYQQETIGVLEVLNPRNADTFTDRDAQILDIFANLAAIGAMNAESHAELIRENDGLRAASQTTDPVIGQSTAWDGVERLIDRVAKTNATVLLLGETGTGKEVCARAIHNRSSRAEKSFVAVNCAALPETLLESELFGHEAGAFTGATERKLGRFELASSGTLFLDEIGDISASTQIKLLRVLQERDFVRVGGTEPISCDVRIITATNRDLRAAITAGQFREDLYYRLNVFPIHLPPLRERTGDVSLLLDHYIERSSREMGVGQVALTEEARALLCAYSWPGNVRELRNVVERAVLLAEAGEIGPGNLPREIAGSAEKVNPTRSKSAVETYEKALIVQALEEHNWNQTRAAAALGLSRDNLRYRLKKYGIRRPT
jgi:Nif-specific regulatory protein